MDTDTLSTTWKDLFRIGCMTSIAYLLLIVLAIVAYFIWPYAPGLLTIESIFVSLRENLPGGLVSLDIFTVIIPPVMVPAMLAVYVGVREVNASYALIGVVFLLMGIVLWLAARPIAEMVYLSELHAAADPAAGIRYLAAGEALNSIFSGTSWMISQVLINTGTLIFSLLMLESVHFSRWTAYTGIFISVIGFGIVVPSMGAVLGMLATIGSIAWFVLLARAFYRLGWR